VKRTKRRNIASFLAHNRGLSFVAEAGGALAGAVLGASTAAGATSTTSPSRPAAGVRGSAAPSSSARSRHSAPGRAPLHIFVMADNADGQRFWERVGWFRRDDLAVMSKDVAPR